MAYRSDRASEFSARLLLGGLGSAQLVVMVVSRMRVEIDDLGPRLLAPATVMLLLLVFAAVGDMAVCWSDASLGGLLQWRRIAAVATVVWCMVGVLATLRFALRDQVRGYDQDAYEAVRHSPVLDRLPEDCAELTHVSKAVPKARGGCVLVGRWGGRPSARGRRGMRGVGGAGVHDGVGRARASTRASVLRCAGKRRDPGPAPSISRPGRPCSVRGSSARATSCAPRRTSLNWAQEPSSSSKCSRRTRRTPATARTPIRVPRRRSR